MATMTNCKQCGERFYADEPWKKVCLDCWKRNKNIQPLAKPAIGIQPDLLTRLIYLVHPDKHHQSDLSCNVTQTLLALKKSLNQ